MAKAFWKEIAKFEFIFYYCYNFLKNNIKNLIRLVICYQLVFIQKYIFYKLIKRSNSPYTERKKKHV